MCNCKECEERIRAQRELESMEWLNRQNTISKESKEREDRIKKYQENGDWLKIELEP